MFRLRGFGVSYWFVAAALFLAAGAAVPQDRDTLEVQRYVLTDAALAKYMAATKKLAALPGGVAGGCDDDDSTTIAEGVARLEATPGARAAITSAGMTTREYTVFVWSLVHNGLAAWAVSQPGGKLPSGTNPANVDFYRKHAAEVESLPKAEQADCDEEAAEDD